MSRALRLLLGAAGLAWTTAAGAQEPWNGWWNARPPPTVATDPGTPGQVGLERRRTANGLEIVAVNGLAGPVVVQLEAATAPPASVPGPPVRAVLAPGARHVLTTIPGDHGEAPPLRLHVVPGVPDAQHRDIEYLYPLRDAPLRITQGFGGGSSHTDPENLYAVDFAAAEGTPVLAARDGTVMQFESRISGQVPPSRDAHAPTNFVRVLHDDGTMALYAHLQRGGVIVAAGTRVRRGQIIAFSGNTGASSGPHLHFAVHANQGMALQSLPFRMFGPHGILRFAAPQLHGD